MVLQRSVSCRFGGGIDVLGARYLSIFCRIGGLWKVIRRGVGEAVDRGEVAHGFWSLRSRRIKLYSCSQRDESVNVCQDPSWRRKMVAAMGRGANAWRGGSRGEARRRKSRKNRF